MLLLCLRSAKGRIERARWTIKNVVRLKKKDTKSSEPGEAKQRSRPSDPQRIVVWRSEQAAVEVTSGREDFPVAGAEGGWLRRRRRMAG